MLTLYNIVRLRRASNAVHLNVLADTTGLLVPTRSTPCSGLPVVRTSECYNLPWEWLWWYMVLEQGDELTVLITDHFLSDVAFLWMLLLIWLHTRNISPYSGLVEGGWRMLGLYNYKGVVFKITLYEGGGVNKSTFFALYNTWTAPNKYNQQYS